MKPIDVKSSTYINSSEEINDEYPAFKTGYIVKISKYKNCKGLHSKFFWRGFCDKKVKNVVLWTFFY